MEMARLVRIIFFFFFPSIFIWTFLLLAALSSLAPSLVPLPVTLEVAGKPILEALSWHDCASESLHEMKILNTVFKGSGGGYLTSQVVIFLWYGRQRRPRKVICGFYYCNVTLLM